MIVCVSANPSLDQILVTRGFKLGGRVEPVRWTTTPGGAGVRVANVIRQMGCPVIATGFHGGGAGEWHAHLMDMADIPHDFITMDAETRGTVLILDEEKGFLVELPGPTPSVSAAQCVALISRVKTLAGKGDWVVLCGRLPLGAPSDLYGQITRVAHENGASVAVDLRGEALLAALAEGPEIWKPDAEEMQEAMALGLDAVAQVERGTTILLSEGANGVLMLRKDNSPVRFAPPPRHAWNPAGSGHAMLAGTVAALHQGSDWHEAARSGLAAGVANMRYDVAGFATVDEVAELAPLVTVTEQRA